MDTYLTTYRKDYLWPYIHTVKLGVPTHATLRSLQQAGPTTHPIVGAQYLMQLSLPSPDGPLRCGCCGCKLSRNQHHVAALLDPEIYPAQVGAAPQSETSRYDQPNMYLRKLQEKYPYMYNILRSSPPEELMKKIYRDRMLTTYQTDYCKEGDFYSHLYDNLIRAGGVVKVSPESIPMILPDCSYRPQQRQAFRPSLISKLGCCHKDKTQVPSMGRPDQDHFPANKWKSEYTDSISKVGEAIIKDKLHHHGSRGPRR